ncbi:AAR099Wp [Eremothecium gossypii ATCC 10895]|uniref:AAR099Wp n=1 Tax=Eremothecium gossypii (strain ATCC 10895 / CBS 109.51 / FGSC 9923 / NRRL Y-1056) TaxID=284811 RepID=Q75EI0_EREGS|nr:AAR099Wp [Eremothecium gossypii ATCC 10895]AAS50464.1 AAR099Wp [Eremothecium gossypii ATCC 10895]
MSSVNKENYRGVPSGRGMKNPVLAGAKRAVLNNVTNTTLSQEAANSNAHSGSGYTNSFGKVLRQAKSKLQSARVAGSLIPQMKREGLASSQEDKENVVPTGVAPAAVAAAAAAAQMAPAIAKPILQSISEESHQECQSLLKDGGSDEGASTVSTKSSDTELAPSSSSSLQSAPANSEEPVVLESGTQLVERRRPQTLNTTLTGSVASSSDCTTSTGQLTESTAGELTTTQNQLRPSVAVAESKKKRPISTIVEPEELKKFKISDQGNQCEWEDLDAEDINDPFMVSEYVNDIFEYLHKLEVMTLPNRHDLFKHANIQQNRDILVNWMVKIHNKFGLLPETLYLALNIMDRFLGKELVQLEKLQLVGTACLFIASKYEEVYSPSVKHFAYETDGACDEEEIKEGEKFILKTLQFNLNYPNPMNFLRRISKADDYDIQSRTLAKYLLEISVVDFKFIGILPSLCAAASMFLSRKMLGKGKWDGNLIHYSGGYSTTELAPICNMLMDYLVQPVVHDELFKKYASRRFMKASVISRQWAKKVMTRSYDIMTLHETQTEY